MSTLLFLNTVASNLPLISLYAFEGFEGVLMIGQSSPDIGGVPADFVKYFLMMTAFVVAGVGGVFWGKRGSKGSPLHIEQPLGVKGEISQAPVYAQQSALEALRKDVDARTRENIRQHEAAAKALADNITQGHNRMVTILGALNEMETRMTSNMLEQIKGLHQRINPLDAQCASHKTAIEGIQSRIQHLWEMIQSLYSQVFRKSAPRS